MRPADIERRFADHERRIAALERRMLAEATLPEAGLVAIDVPWTPEFYDEAIPFATVDTLYWEAELVGRQFTGRFYAEATAAAASQYFLGLTMPFFPETTMWGPCGSAESFGGAGEHHLLIQPGGWIAQPWSDPPGAATLNFLVPDSGSTWLGDPAYPVDGSFYVAGHFSYRIWVPEPDEPEPEP